MHFDTDSCCCIQCRNSLPPDVSALDALSDYTIAETPIAEKSRFKCIVYKTNNKYYEILTLYDCVEK